MISKHVIARVLAMLVMSVAWVGADAANVEFLNINFAGKMVSIALAEHPVITYANNTLTVKTATQEVEVPVAQISGYGFTEEPSAVRDLQLDKPIVDGGKVVFAQLAPGTPVMVVDTAGRQVIATTATASGTALVDLSTLPKAVYVVKAADTTFKVTNK